MHIPMDICVFTYVVVPKAKGGKYSSILGIKIFNCEKKRRFPILNFDIEETKTCSCKWCCKLAFKLEDP